jgi:hypothetical protein
MPRFLFPDPERRSRKQPTVLCPAERVLALYNQDHEGQEAQRISKKVREWFFDQAHEAGWDGLHFIPEVQSRHGAGCVMWVTFEAGHRVLVTNQILVLEDSDADADE